jgi:hypothetical protein
MDRSLVRNSSQARKEKKGGDACIRNRRIFTNLPKTLRVAVYAHLYNLIPDPTNKWAFSIQPTVGGFT